ncbi:MAG: hypothetical protein WBZ36_17410 [Candidatus Nitrosopolaris sp.]
MIAAVSVKDTYCELEIVVTQDNNLRHNYLKGFQPLIDDDISKDA